MQRRWVSLLESASNTAAGFWVSLLVWIYLVVPLYGIEVSMRQNLEITGIFTLASIARGYVLRRIYNRASVRALTRRQSNA